MFLSSDVLVNGLDLSLYGGVDPRDLPRYTYPESSRATGVPVSTVAAWVRGMPYTRSGKTRFFQPVIERPDPNDPRLSFNNVLEVYVLRALREVHEVKLDKIRQAIQIAREEEGVDRVLIDPQLRTTGGDLFLNHYLELVTLSHSRQMAMRAILQAFLQRVAPDRSWLTPQARNPNLSGSSPVFVSPFVSFGNAIIQRRGVSTNVIASRLNLGESRQDIVEDYELTEDEFEEAILYEAAA